MTKIARALLAAAALGLVAAAVLPLHASRAATSRSSYSFSIAGIRVGAASFAFEQSGSSYSAATRIDTAGVVGMLTDFFFDGQASGRLGANGKVVPQLFTATSKSPRALRKSRIEWKDGTPVTVSVEPPRDSAPDPSEQGGTLDPVSASLRLLRDAPANEICDTTVLVYDGSRVSRLKVAPATEDGERLVCAGTYARLKGEASSMVGAREFPFSITFRRTGDGMATLERVEAPTNFGQAVIARMD
jgi:hypothetical protein